MRIILNGEEKITSAKTLEELLSEAAFSARVATARNECFVPAHARADCLLEDNDRIEVVAPMQGG